MKLSGASAAKYIAKPYPARAGLLIFGPDAMRVALKRQDAVLAIAGPQADAEMRLTRKSGADLRRDTAALSDAMRAVGFFPGPRVVFVEEATDGLADLMAQALHDWRPGDAQIVVTAGNLTAKSALRKAFEDSGAGVAIAIYNDPPSREEIEADLKRAGLTGISSEAAADLGALARALDPGDFRQTLEKIALYKWGDKTPLVPEDVAACAPATIEAEVDDVIHATADLRRDEIGPLMRRLEGQGVLPVTLCIGALRHFKALHAAAADDGGGGRGRQPYGPRRDQSMRQAQAWGVHRLEDALRLLLETDLTLRSSIRAPAMAVMERTLLRLASGQRG